MSDTETAAKPQDDVVVCDACPVLCRIRPGKTGDCDRYANIAGVLTRQHPLVLAQQLIDERGSLVPFLSSPEWDGSLVSGAPTFVTGIGSGTTYPDYTPAPFMLSIPYRGVRVRNVGA